MKVIMTPKYQQSTRYWKAQFSSSTNKQLVTDEEWWMRIVGGAQCVAFKQGLHDENLKQRQLA